MGVKKQLIPLIEREDKICELAIEQLNNRCKLFEKKYELSSQDFYGRFQEGSIGDEQDFFEWKALLDGIRNWTQAKEGLKELNSD